MIDLIDRQDVIKMIQKTEQMHPYKVPGNRESYDKYAEAWNDATCLIEGQMAFIPSVIIEDAERKKGRWIYDTERVTTDGLVLIQYHCSECGFQSFSRMNFCGYCGSDMRGE